MPSDIHDTLKERGSKHGKFSEHARITQAIKQAMVDSPNWNKLPDDMKEALEMDAHKTGRILAGDFDYHDHWYDKVGYITLVADRLVNSIKPQQCPKVYGALGRCTLHYNHADHCVASGSIVYGLSSNT